MSARHDLAAELSAAAGDGVDVTADPLHYADWILAAGWKPPAQKHHRVGPGACACGFDAYKLSEFVFDYGDRLDIHLRAARRSS